MLKFGLRTVVFAVGTLAGAMATAQPLEPLDPPQEVTVAYVPIMKFATAYVAAERGLFDKYGLDVEFERVKSGTEAIAFLQQGSIDIGGIAIVTSLWSGWNRGMDLKIIAPGGLEPLENSTTGLYVRKALIDDGTVGSVADLEGMRVATAGGPGSGGEYLATKALARGDLTIRDVELINVGNPDIPQSMAGGAIDAAISGPPFVDVMVNAGDAVLLEGDLAPGLMTVAFVASGQFLSERPEAAQRFVAALMEAARLMQGDDYLSPENMAAYMRFTNSDEAALRSGVPVVYDPELEIPIEGLRDVETVHRENGRTEYEEPLDLEKVYDASLVERAREALATQ